VSHDHLVGVSSQIDRTRMLVVPNDVAASYLMLMLARRRAGGGQSAAGPPPGNIGFMPQNAGSRALCAVKARCD